jgi:cobalt-precorrin-5B (C1)-methyltransferase
VQITLPKGKVVQMRLEFCRLTGDGAEAGTSRMPATTRT